MRKIFFTFLINLLFSISAFSQTARKIDEISGFVPCGEMSMRIDSYNQSELWNKSQNKLYVIYYEGAEKTLVTTYNPKTKKYKKTLENPRFGNALNRAKEIPLYLKMAYKVSSDRVILINGGFRVKLELEVWSVSDSDKIPEPTPTVERKDVKFSKKKAFGIRKLALCYEGL